jgi:hypothetical protein
VGDGFDVGLIQGHRSLQLESIEWTRAGVSADDGAELWWHGCRACLVLGCGAGVAAFTARSPARRGRRGRRVCLGRDYAALRSHVRLRLRHWPWNGLNHHCNVFDAHAKLKCPWCDSKIAGSLSMLAVFGASGAAALGISASDMLRTASMRTRLTLGVLAGNPCLSSRVAGDGGTRRARHGLPAAVHRLAVVSSRQP